MTTNATKKKRAKIILVGGLLLAALVTSVGLSACGPVKRPDGGTGLLPVGSSAPDVEGHDATGKAIRLSEMHGHAAVVYFYPKDGTPGCTHEACAFRDAFQRYQTRGVVIFGVSRDSDESHKDFLANQSLPFPLVSDQDGSVDRAYGVLTGVEGGDCWISEVILPPKITLKTGFELTAEAMAHLHERTWRVER